MVPTSLGWSPIHWLEPVSTGGHLQPSSYSNLLREHTLSLSSSKVALRKFPEIILPHVAMNLSALHRRAFLSVRHCVDKLARSFTMEEYSQYLLPGPPITCWTASLQKRFLLVLTSPRQCTPLLSIASAVFKPANHDRVAEAHAPTLCYHGSMSRMLVA